ncbi:anthranilate phosphoribosyltransferase [Halodesulfovibrio aestuarii]|uniref:Anthranilate phosphoribosyltransferase n=1 Tax=Halodesulfovibrio aestuarii TaxID=126333 RepID=A0ABV4JY23_9BACT
MDKRNKKMNTTQILEQLADGKHLNGDVAHCVFTELMDGKMTSGQAGSLLMGLRQKGETAEEIHAAVRVCLERAKPVEAIEGATIDLVGTGGDGKHSFNCSTATALTLAGMGYTVTKHGNRAVSSSCGSADAVEGLGLPLRLLPEEIPAELAKRNFAFLFAPDYHPAFKHVMPVRKELGYRTLFNLLGPLLNPARPTHMLLGVAKPEFMEIMAEVLAQAGVERAAVVHGAGGYDELTTNGIAKVIFVENGTIRHAELDPAEFGFEPCAEEDLAVQGKEEGLAVLHELLEGKGPKAMQDMLALNTGMALHLITNEPLKTCMERAREAVAAGVGRKVLDA